MGVLHTCTSQGLTPILSLKIQRAVDIDRYSTYSGEHSYLYLTMRSPKRL